MKLSIGSICRECHITPSDYADPDHEVLLGYARWKFDVECLNLVAQAVQPPTTTSGKVREEYKGLSDRIQAYIR